MEQWAYNARDHELIRWKSAEARRRWESAEGGKHAKDVCTEEADAKAASTEEGAADA